MTRAQERLAVYAFGVLFIATMLVLAVLFPDATGFRFVVFKTVLAIAAAGIAAFIPGVLDLQIGKYGRAGGALAVFAAVYFFSPADAIDSPERQRSSNIKRWNSIVAKHRNHPTDVVRAALVGLNSEKQSLAGVDLSGANLNDINLAGADLRAAKLVGTQLQRAGLEGAYLKGADLSNADLSHGKLSGINPANEIPGLRDIGAVLFGSVPKPRGPALDKDNEDRAQEAQNQQDERRLAWNESTNMRLDGANLSRATLDRANLRGASIRKANLTFAKLTHATLGEAQIQGSYLQAADLNAADLSFADLTDTGLHSANLDRANLSHTNLSGVGMCGVTARGADFEAATIPLADWEMYAESYDCGFGSMGGTYGLCGDDKTKITPPTGGQVMEMCADGARMAIG